MSKDKGRASVQLSSSCMYVFSETYITIAKRNYLSVTCDQSSVMIEACASRPKECKNKFLKLTDSRLNLGNFFIVIFIW